MSESKTPHRPAGRALGLLIPSTLVLAAFALPGAEGETAAQSAGFRNLHVLPRDASEDQVFGAMLDNLRGLGLPRRDSEGCLYCHVGSMDTSSDTWDYAADDKLEKRKAREMMSMVAEINGRLDSLESRLAPELRVTCATCHAGRTDPRPLPDVLRSTYAESGIEATIARYESLRERYFGADAYDFRPSVLAGFAAGLATSGAFDDAIALAEINATVYPTEPVAHRTVLGIELQRAYASTGVAGATAAFERLAAGARGQWLSYQVLDGLGWGLHRRGAQVEAITLFQFNTERFPDEYVAHESLADAHYFADEPDVEAAIRVYESWLERHPDHEIAQRRLRDRRSGQ